MPSERSIEASNAGAMLGGLILGGVTGYLQKQSQQKAQNRQLLADSLKQAQDSGNDTAVSALLADKKNKELLFGKGDIADSMSAVALNSAKMRKQSLMAQQAILAQNPNMIQGGVPGQNILAGEVGAGAMSAADAAKQIGQEGTQIAAGQNKIAGQQAIAAGKNATTLQAAGIHAGATKEAAQIRANATVKAAGTRSGAQSQAASKNYNTVFSAAQKSLRDSFKDSMKGFESGHLNADTYKTATLETSIDAASNVLAANPNFDPSNPETSAALAQQVLLGKGGKGGLMDEMHTIDPASGKPATMRSLMRTYKNDKERSAKLQQYINYVIDQAVTRATMRHSAPSGPLLGGGSASGGSEDDSDAGE